MRNYGLTPPASFGAASIDCCIPSKFAVLGTKGFLLVLRASFIMLKKSCFSVSWSTRKDRWSPFNMVWGASWPWLVVVERVWCLRRIGFDVREMTWRQTKALMWYQSCCIFRGLVNTNYFNTNILALNNVVHGSDILDNNGISCMLFCYLLVGKTAAMAFDKKSGMFVSMRIA